MINLKTRFALLAASLAVCAVAAPGGAMHSPIPESVLLKPEKPVQRIMRGDWETPDGVLVVESPVWPETVTGIVNALADQVPVYVITHREDPDRDDLRELDIEVDLFDNVHWLKETVDTAWVRDYGPFQITDASGDPLWLDPLYSAEREEDDRLPQRLAHRFGVQREAAPEQLDGGAFISNGRGICVSTVEFFEENGLSPEEPDHMEALLPSLGCQVLALVPALVHEETKHADLFAQFVGPETLAWAELDSSEFPEDAERMEAGVEAVMRAAQSLGQPMRVHRIPLHRNSEKLYLTSLNGLRAVDRYLIPQYRRLDPEFEKRVFAAWAEVQPDLSLIPIPADSPLEYAGAVHCLTLGLYWKPASLRRRPVTAQQLPKREAN